MTAPARKSRKKLFQALLQSSLDPRTHYIVHQFTQNKRTWCQSILSLFVTLFAPTILTSGSKEFYLKDPKNLEYITRILFSGRRKMINKSFSKLFQNSMSVAKDLNIDLKNRPEELSVEMYYRIAMKYEELSS